MPLADVVVKSEDMLEYSISDKGRQRVQGKRVYWCLTDNAYEPFSVVAFNTQVWPKIGNRVLEQVGDVVDWGGTPNIVRSRQFSYVRDSERIIQVDVAYDGFDDEENDEENRPTEDESTWLRITISSSQITKPATDKDGNSFTNSAGDPVDGLEAESAIITLTYTNEAVEDPKFKSFYKYLNSCNDDVFLGCKKYTLRCTGISAEYDQAKQTWRVAVEFTHNPDGWEIAYYDAGYNEVVSGKRRAILDDRGNPVNQPVPLDGEGKAAAPATGVEVDAEGESRYFKAPKLVTLKAKPYPTQKFRNLFTELRI